MSTFTHTVLLCILYGEMDYFLNLLYRMYDKYDDAVL